MPRRLGSTIDPEPGLLRAAFLASNDFVDNLIYRFGKNNSQRLQFFIQDQDITQTLDYGGYKYLPYISGGTNAGQCAPYPVQGPNGPINSAQQQYACSSLIPLFPGQPNTYAFVSQADQLKSPFLAYKVEYGANLGSIVAADRALLPHVRQQSQDMPAQGIFACPYGGTRTAGQIDVTTQVGEKNLLKYGTIYDYVVPFGTRYDLTSYTAFTVPSYIVTYPITHPQPAAAAALHVSRASSRTSNPAHAVPGLEQDFFSPSFCAAAQPAQLAAAT